MGKIFVRFKDLIINLLIILAGVLVAIIVFAILQNIDHKKERNSLIPNATEAYKNKEYSRAINLYLRAEKEFPDNAEVKRNLGELYYLKGKYDDSLKYYKQIPTAGMDKLAYHNIGDIYLRKSDVDKAIELWKDADLDPTDSYRLAKIYYEKGDIENYFATLTKINTYREPLVLTAIRSQNINDIPGMVDKANTLAPVSDDKLDLDLFKNQIQESIKQLNLNKKDFSDLIQISAYSNLNQCKLLFDRISQLRTSLDAKKVPTFQLDYYEGNCDNQVGEPDKAVPLIENAIKADATIVEYREALAKSFFLKKDAEKIKQIYNDIFTLQKSSVYYENLSVYLYKLDLKDDALANYDLAFTNAKTDEDKKRLARLIIQINMLDKKNLEVCRRSDILDLVKNENEESILLRGHCLLYLNNNLDVAVNDLSVATKYLNALQKKDRKLIDKALDQDTDGMVTTYYKAVGVQILR